MPHRFSLKGLFSLLILGVLITSCGYHFRSSRSKNPFEGVEKLHVPYFINRSHQEGAETPFTNALVRELNAVGHWDLVSDEEDADAIVYGVIEDSQSNIRSYTKAGDLPKGGLETDDEVRVSGGADALVVSQFVQSIRCEITVLRKKDQRVLFRDEFSRGETYAAANRKGIGGSTSPTINRSRRRETTGSLADAMMSEAVSIMLRVF
jgi:hypothetical protein